MASVAVVFVTFWAIMAVAGTRRSSTKRATSWAWPLKGLLKPRLAFSIVFLPL